MEIAIPHLRILDYNQAVAFYVDDLEFRIAFEWRHEPGSPVYMGVRRGSLYVHLSEHEGSGPPGQGRGMTLAVDDIDSWYRRLTQKGVSFDRILQTQPWGSREFVIHDPFGNTIVFTSDVK